MALPSSRRLCALTLTNTAKLISSRPTTQPLPHSNLLSRSNIQHRMSSSAAGAYEWLCIIPDHENALDKRLAARPQHLENIGPHIKSGKVLLGGATLSEQPAEGESPKMTGSVMLFKANTKEEVLEAIKNDIYTKSGAWNPDAVIVYPFKSAVRVAL